MKGLEHHKSGRQIMPHEVLVDGSAIPSYRKQRYLMRIDGNEIPLPFHIFRVLALLALRRDIDGGWVDRSLLVWSDEWAKRYVSKTREVIRGANWLRPGGVDGAWMVIEANLDRVHQYRLIANPEAIRVNPELVHFDDRTIASEATAFLSRAANRLICPGHPDDDEAGRQQ